MLKPEELANLHQLRQTLTPHRTFAELTDGKTHPEPADYREHKEQWRKVRVEYFETLTRSLSPDQKILLGDLLQAHAQEHLAKGAEVSVNKDRGSQKRMSAAAHQEAARKAQERNEQNRTINNLLKKAADDNAQLRQQLHEKTNEAESVRRQLRELTDRLLLADKNIRQHFSTNAPADYIPLPRLRGRTLNFRYIKEENEIEVAARTIYEFMTSPECHGYCPTAKLKDRLHYSVRPGIFQHALDHLVLNGKLTQSSSGAAYKVIKPGLSPEEAVLKPF